MAKREPVTDVAETSLTEQEWKFIEAHAVANMPPRQAMVFAGYAYDTRSLAKMMAKPHIAAAIAEVRRTTAERLNITREKIYTGLMTAIDQATIMADPMAQIAGWREVGKIAGFYDEAAKDAKNLTDVQSQFLKQIKEKSDDELLLMMATPVGKGITIDG